MRWWWAVAVDADVDVDVVLLRRGFVFLVMRWLFYRI
jgi:hypothetical protein